MATNDDTTEDWTSAWPDALAFGGGLAMAWWGKWTTTDLVWSLWLSSLVVGYATIVWTILRPAIYVARGSWRDGVLTMQASDGRTTVRSAALAVPFLVAGGLFLLAFFTFHFGMFHYVHSQFLGSFFPIDAGAGRRGWVGMATYLEVARRYWWFLRPGFLAERAGFAPLSGTAEGERPAPVVAIGAPREAVKGSSTGSAMLAPYRNVVRMHLLIFFFAFAHAAKLDSFAVYAVVYAVYFFPWRLVRRAAA